MIKIPADSVIFDLDGTLWDSRENVCRSWNIVLRENYTDLPELTVEGISRHMGKLMPDITRGLFPELPDADIMRITELCCVYENEYIAQHGGILYDGVEDTLRELSQRYKLAIVSNCQSGYIEAFFAAHGLDKYFYDFESNGRTSLSKADNIRLVKRRSGFENPIYVGDTALDESSAHAAGLPFVWAAYGFGRSDSFEAKLESFAQLKDILL